MKNLKVLLLAIVAVLGLSSCLGGSDPIVRTHDIVKVENFYGAITLKSAAGYVIRPNNPMDPNVMNLKGPFAQIIFQYNRDEVKNPIKEVNANILAAEDIVQLLVSPGASLAENAPMAPIMQGASSQVLFFDKDNIFLPVSFFYKQFSDQTQQTAEINSHYFELYQIENDNAEADNITLRLVHHVNDASQDKDRRSVGTMLQHINLADVLAGRVPEKLIIKFTKSQEASFDKADKELTSIEINYKSIYDQYLKPKK